MLAISLRALVLSSIAVLSAASADASTLSTYGGGFLVDVVERPPWPGDCDPRLCDPPIGGPISHRDCVPAPLTHCGCEPGLIFDHFGRCVPCPIC